jgi:hypothetical protein
MLDTTADEAEAGLTTEPVTPGEMSDTGYESDTSSVALPTPDDAFPPDSALGRRAARLRAARDVFVGAYAAAGLTEARSPTGGLSRLLSWIL